VIDLQGPEDSDLHRRVSGCNRPVGVTQPPSAIVTAVDRSGRSGKRR
jgi:hypothetical protein